jgi:hypothetical protein
MEAALSDTRSHVQQRVDKLIDWFEQNRPGYLEAINVGVIRRTAMRFARPAARGGELIYRGHVIVPRDSRGPKRKQMEL